MSPALLLPVGGLFSSLTLSVLGVLVLVVAALTVFYFLRARVFEQIETSLPTPGAEAAGELRALGDRLEMLVGQQQLQGETQRQVLAQKIDAIGERFDEQRHAVDGLRNEMRHEVRRRDSEIEEIRHQIAAIQQGVSALPAATPLALGDGAADAQPDVEPAPAPFTPDEVLPFDAFTWEAPAETPAMAPAETPADPFAQTTFEPFAVDAPGADAPDAPAPPAAFEPAAFEPAAFEPTAFEVDLAEPGALEPAGIESTAFEPAAVPEALPAAGIAPPAFTVTDAFGAIDPFEGDAVAAGFPASALDPAPAPAPAESDPDVFSWTVVDAFAAPAPEPLAPAMPAPPPADSASTAPEQAETFDAWTAVDEPVSPVAAASAVPVAPAVAAPVTVPSPVPGAPRPGAGDAWVALANRPAPTPAPAPPAVAPAETPLAVSLSSVVTPPAPEPTAVPEPVAPAPDAAAPAQSPASADDLTMISSIDADVQRALYMAGITKLDEIARWGRADARRIASEVGVSEEMIMGQWIFEAQAALFDQYARQAR